MGLAIGLRIKPPDARISVLQTEFELRADEHNSLAELCYVQAVQSLSLCPIFVAIESSSLRPFVRSSADSTPRLSMSITRMNRMGLDFF